MTILLSQTAFGFSISQNSVIVDEGAVVKVIASTFGLPNGYALTSFQWEIDETAYRDILNEQDLTFPVPQINSGVDR